MLGEGEDIAEMLGPCRAWVNRLSFFAFASKHATFSPERPAPLSARDCPHPAVGIRIMVFQAIPVSIEAD